MNPTVLPTLAQVLDREGVGYDVIPHPRTESALEEAAAIVVLNAQVRHAAAQYGSTLLTSGPLGWLFLAGAVGVGLVGTLALAGIAISTDSDVALVLGSSTDLAGHFFVFFSLLRAGLHAPIRPLPLRRAPAAAGA